MATTTNDAHFTHMVQTLNGNVALARSKFTKLERAHHENGTVLDYETSEMVRRTDKNNNRKLRYNAGKVFVSSAGLGVAVASGGTAFLAVGGVMFAGSMNRWRREVQYKEKMIASMTIIQTILEQEQQLINNFIEAVRNVDASLRELCFAISQLPTRTDVIRKLNWVKINCPLLKNFIINEAAPNVLGQTAAYFILHHPEASFEVAMAMAPNSVTMAMSLGPEGLIHLMAEGFQLVAAVGVVITIVQAAMAQEEAEADAKEVQTILQVMEQRKMHFKELKVMLPPF